MLAVDSSAFVRSFAWLRKRDTEIAGDRSANLGALASTSFPVPRGIVITANAYLNPMASGKLRARLLEVEGDALSRGLHAMAEHRVTSRENALGV